MVTFPAGPLSWIGIRMSGSAGFRMGTADQRDVDEPCTALDVREHRRLSHGAARDIDEVAPRFQPRMLSEDSPARSLAPFPRTPLLGLPSHHTLFDLAVGVGK